MRTVIKLSLLIVVLLVVLMCQTARGDENVTNVTIPCLSYDELLMFYQVEGKQLTYRGKTAEETIEFQLWVNDQNKLWDVVLFISDENWGCIWMNGSDAKLALPSQ